MRSKNASLFVGLLCCALRAVSLQAASGHLRVVEAAKKGDTATVRALLKSGGDVRARWGDGATALHWMAYRDDAATAALLIAAGANVNAANDLGVTPLWVASSTGATAVMATLLRAGGDPNISPATGGTPMMVAARTGSVEAVKLLIAHGADVNATEAAHSQNAMMWAVALRKPQVVQVLLDAGANLHARTAVTRRYVLLCCSRYNGDPGVQVWMNYGGFTPVLFAARSGDVESARLLLESGANPNDVGADNHSALAVAALSNQGKVAALLAQHGANVNAAAGGFTALHAAVLRNDLELAKVLLSYGADVNARLTNATPARRGNGDVTFDIDLVGATPYLLAAREGAKPFMHLLAASGADLSLGLPNGSTPLMMAALGERGARSGADAFDQLDLTGKRDRGPEQAALAGVQAVLEIGADVNAVDRAGQAAVHIAAQRRFDSVIQLLADKGARLDLRDRDGRTPLAVALTPLPMPKGAIVGNGGADVVRPTDYGPETAALLRKLGATE